MRKLVIVGVAAAATFGVSVDARADTVLLEGNQVNTSNCIPFGNGASYGNFQGFVYKNVDNFSVNPGDTLSFDLSLQNDANITMNIALAKAISNGSNQPDGNGFTQVVTNGTPADPNGDNVQLNYELVFTVDNSFAFNGGGLIVRFEPVGGFKTDNTCTQVLTYSTAGDTSNLFVSRFYAEPDGNYPWSSTDTSYIGVLKIDFEVDSDSDGVPDSQDNCPNDANPNQADADNDGLGDVCDACPDDPDNDTDNDGVCGDVDNCPDDANPNQNDADNDGDGDACDSCPDDADNDIDNDGVCGDVDNCPDDPNPNQENADNDLFGDACDLCPDDTLDDSDSDGVCDMQDNCPADSNAGQEDADDDGAGDVCDVCPGDADDDIDQDGVCGDEDNCPDDPNPGQEDGDDDGAGDACDADVDTTGGSTSGGDGTGNGTSGGDGGTVGSDGGADTSGPSTTGSSISAGTGITRSDSGDDSCACRSSWPGHASWWLVPVVFFARRRRTR